MASLISRIRKLFVAQPAFDGRQFYDLLVAVARRHGIVGLVLDKAPPIDLTFWNDMAAELTRTLKERK